MLLLLLLLLGLQHKSSITIFKNTILSKLKKKFITSSIILSFRYYEWIHWEDIINLMLLNLCHNKENIPNTKVKWILSLNTVQNVTSQLNLHF